MKEGLFYADFPPSNDCPWPGIIILMEIISAHSKGTVVHLCVIQRQQQMEGRHPV